jgi:hypothetical protein
VTTDDIKARPSSGSSLRLARLLRRGEGVEERVCDSRSRILAKLNIGMLLWSAMVMVRHSLRLGAKVSTPPPQTYLRERSDRGLEK